MREVWHSFKYIFGHGPGKNIDFDEFSINHAERLNTLFWGESHKQTNYFHFL